LCKKDRRYYAYAVVVVIQLFKGVLLDLNGIIGTDCHTLSAVDAEFAENPCLASGDADGFGRATFHAMCATLAFLFNYMQR